MKKVCIFLCLILLLCLAGCRKIQPSNIFFEEETLRQLHLEGLPQPPGNDNRIRKNEDMLLLSLTEAEYSQYVRQLAQYLQDRQDAYFVSYVYRQAPELLFFSYDCLAPMGPDYDYSDDSHIFLFSRNPELTATLCLQDPIRIAIRRESNDLFGDFTYNTILEISTGSRAMFAPCEVGHFYDDGRVYPIAGSEETVMIGSCIYCQSRGVAPFYNGSRRVLMVTEGGEYLKNDPQGERYGGMVYSLRTRITVDHDLVVKANGVPIPKSGYGPDYWEYEFVMPCENVQITITPAEGGPVPPSPDRDYLFFYEPWLRELSPDQVTQIRTVREPIAAAPGSLKQIHCTADPAAIAGMLRIYNVLAMPRLNPEKDEEGGNRLTVEFMLTDGTIYSLTFRNNCYTAADGTVLQADNLPTLAPFVNVTESFGFVTDQTQCPMYDGQTGQLAATFTGLVQMEFVPTDAPEAEMPCLYRIETEFGTLQIYSDTLFCLQDAEGNCVWYTLTYGPFPDWVETP